jgi:predicted nucleic acid-binding protein
MNFLIDTNVLSEMRKRAPDPAVVTWIKARSITSLFISVLTLGEIRKGVELISDGVCKQALNDWLMVELPVFFAGRVLAVDERVSDRWGKLVAAAGRPVPAIDSLLAATAVEHGLQIATRNVKDFEAFQVATVNPWLI